MMIWGAALIPILVLLVLYAFYQRKVLGWEFLLQMAVPLAVIALCKLGVETSQTNDKEYWGGWVARAEYDEEWNEKVPCRHEKECTHRDKKGNRKHSNDGYKHAYDVDNHPPVWQAVGSNQETIFISSRTFEELCQKFGSRKFVEINRDYHTIDGDRYVTEWDRSDERLEAVTTIHSYENRVQASSSVFTFPEVNPEDYGLFDYPKITGDYDCESLLGDGGSTTEKARRLLTIANARLGAQKQVRMFVIVFKNQPLQAGFDQQSYWKGGNKNEFVLTIGVDSQCLVQWCHPFSWSEVEDLKVDARNMVISQKALDLVAVVEWLADNIRMRFRRKEFKEFSYLAVEPSLWGVAAAYGITLLASVCLAVWSVKNQYNEANPGGRPRSRGFRRW